MKIGKHWGGRLRTSRQFSAQRLGGPAGGAIGAMVGHWHRKKRSGSSRRKSNSDPEAIVNSRIGERRKGQSAQSRIFDGAGGKAEPGKRQGKQPWLLDAVGFDYRSGSHHSRFDVPVNDGGHTCWRKRNPVHDCWTDIARL